MPLAFAPATVYPKRLTMSQNTQSGPLTIEQRNNLRSLAENYPKLVEPLTHAMPFEKPALFIRGGQSDYLTAADEPLIRQLFPQAVLKTIPDAGHWIHADQLEAFLALVLEFL